MGGPGPWIERFAIFLTFHVVGLFLRWAGRVRIVGREHIPPGGGVLFLANHISALDVFLLPWCIYEKFPQEMLRQVSKEELLRIPVLGWWFGKIRAFPIKRGRADLSAIRAIEGFIKSDKVVIYPEGTRSRDGKLGAGNRMVGRFIRSAKPTVIPVAIKGTDQVFPVGKMLPRRGANMEVIFGPPLDLSKEYEIENMKESSLQITGKVMKAISALLEGNAAAGAVPAKAAEEAGG